jgi:hypothetical protein
MPPLENYERDSQAAGKIIPFSGINFAEALETAAEKQPVIPRK